MQIIVGEVAVADYTVCPLNLQVWIKQFAKLGHDGSFMEDDMLMQK